MKQAVSIGISQLCLHTLTLFVRNFGNFISKGLQNNKDIDNELFKGGW
jgi:hypothetical protein